MMREVNTEVTVLSVFRFSLKLTRPAPMSRGPHCCEPLHCNGMLRLHLISGTAP